LFEIITMEKVRSEGRTIRVGERIVFYYAGYKFIGKVDSILQKGLGIILRVAYTTSSYYRGRIQCIISLPVNSPWKKDSHSYDKAAKRAERIRNIKYAFSDHFDAEARRESSIPKKEKTKYKKKGPPSYVERENRVAQFTTNTTASEKIKPKRNPYSLPLPPPPENTPVNSIQPVENTKFPHDDSGKPFKDMIVTTIKIPHQKSLRTTHTPHEKRFTFGENLPENSSETITRDRVQKQSENIRKWNTQILCEVLSTRPELKNSKKLKIVGDGFVKHVSTVAKKKNARLK